VHWQAACFQKAKGSFLREGIALHLVYELISTRDGVEAILVCKPLQFALLGETSVFVDRQIQFRQGKISRGELGNPNSLE